ncbi:unnamed protein product [Mytilus coruscus]|uniref:Endonuclease/exonuclease/phosphatase domain-containing protein n=1 Tax=Mytilus coruscus TaxID=42192 RepID=A0A6J8CIS9_MYTCO|nr:unnamed protein product [Mytilus coruscus]
MYEGDIYYSNGTDGRQGVAVLASKYYKDKIKCIYKDDQGRFIHVTYHENDTFVNFVSLYAPNVVSDRGNFFDFVIDYTKDLDNLIIGGDFNTSLSVLDRGSKTCHMNDEPYRKLTKLMDDNNLYDIWRARNPDCRIFSWKRISEGKLQQSRIDYFLVSRNMSSFVQSLYYNVTSMSDHSFVIMNLNCTCIERGPGLWVLNNTLLFNEEYVQRVKDIISQEKESELFHRDLLVWWDNLKYRIKRYSQILSSDLAKQNKREYYKLERQINNLCEKAASGIVIDIAKLESLKLEMSNFEIEKCKGAVLRAKAIWAVESDKNTKYFLNLEKYKQESNAIKELLNENGDTVSDTEGILELQHSFFSDLYSCVTTDENKMSELLNYVTKTVNEDDNTMCNDDVTEDELCKAINQLSKNKSPGSDGLTVEFYCKFYSELKYVLLKLFDAIEEEGTLSRSMKCGIISLVYKKKGERNILKNYRPISLLQVDYKILARIMSNRLKSVLPKIISEDQTCCVIGRDISNNISNVRDIMELVERDDLEGYFLN